MVWKWLDLWVRPTVQFPEEIVMPKVGSKKFSYDNAGVEKAKRESERTGLPIEFEDRNYAQYSDGGKVGKAKGYSKGGKVRGAGAATRGTRFRG